MLSQESLPHRRTLAGGTIHGNCLLTGQQDWAGLAGAHTFSLSNSHMKYMVVWQATSFQPPEATISTQSSSS